MFYSKALFALTLCLTFLAHAQVTPVTLPKPSSLFNFNCATEIPSTSFLFTDDDDDHFKVRILHHNGSQYAPFVQRLVTANDMASLLEAAEVAKNTGNDIGLRWEKKSCKRLNDEMFSCMGGGESLTSA